MAIATSQLIPLARSTWKKTSPTPRAQDSDVADARQPYWQTDQAVDRTLGFRWRTARPMPARKNKPPDLPEASVQTRSARQARRFTYRARDTNSDKKAGIVEVGGREFFRWWRS